jgi:NAD kinase
MPEGSEVATVAPRAVVVSRPTEYQALLARHGTREQARFWLAARGRSLTDVEERQARQEAALAAVAAAIPPRWRRARVARDDLSRFLFGPQDVVVAVGQDGLVANVAKYLAGQPVVGLNPDPRRHDGVLVPHPPERAAALLAAVAAGRASIQQRRMAEARLDDGQRLLALNEVFIGHRTHQSARYRLRCQAGEEAQSSSGVIVTTGTGATGWARSIGRQRREPPPLPRPEDPVLAFFVREPFPSVATTTAIEQGLLRDGEGLEIVSEMNEGGTVFADGIEDDRLELGWGMRLRVGLAEERLHLVAA